MQLTSRAGHAQASQSEAVANPHGWDMMSRGSLQHLATIESASPFRYLHNRSNSSHCPSIPAVNRSWTYDNEPGQRQICSNGTLSGCSGPTVECGRARVVNSLVAERMFSIEDDRPIWNPAVSPNPWTGCLGLIPPFQVRNYDALSGSLLI